jgi:hypothetical protein
MDLDLIHSTIPLDEVGPMVSDSSVRDEATTNSLLFGILTSEEVPAADDPDNQNIATTRINLTEPLTRRKFHPRRYPATPTEKPSRPDSGRNQIRLLDLAALRGSVWKPGRHMMVSV